ncbi:MAG: 4Fe-4S binding protein [Candidatus Woesearchaeota archaeon]|jgi:NAD-dependent dihydropyrimidine dehydrogenase PreA subunit
MPIKIDYKKCCYKNGKCQECTCKTGGKCDGCVEACPVGALVRKKIVEFNPKLCIDCGSCVPACKHDAIKMI